MTVSMSSTPKKSLMLFSGRAHPELAEEIARLDASAEEFSVHVVEVCRTCSWNHLVQSYVAGLPPQTGLTTDTAVFTEAYAVIPRSVMRDIVPPRHLGSSVGTMSASLGIGGALGLPISALVTEHADWHGLFWMAAGLGAVVFALVLWIVPVSVLRTAGRFDYVGAAGLAVGLLGILLAISRGHQWGWASPATLGCGLGGIAVLIVWGRYELRIAEPLLDLRVAARRPVLLTNLASVAMGFSLFSSNVSYPQL